MKYSVYILFLFLCIYSFIEIKELQTLNQSQINMYETVVNEKIDLYIHKISREQELLLSGKILDKNIVVCDIKGEEKTLQDICHETKLIFYFSVLHCDLCINSQLSILNSRSVNLGGNIYILFYSENNRDIKLYQKQAPNISIYKLSQPLKEEINQPYYFIYDNFSTRVTNVFIPEKTDLNFTEQYLNSTMKKYFNQIKILDL